MASSDTLPKLAMTIKVLPPDIAARIAAGEVVERPASAVKELLENALDAGSTVITIQVVGGGLESILVSDNGHGIAYGDTQFLFQRHATSKIESENDLSEITSYGFRGEALHSLSAVAETSVLTRQSGEISGTLLHANDGKIQKISQQASRIGTTVTVNKLFSKFPARKKFLRSSQSEISRVKSVVHHYALAYPEVQFKLIVEGRTVITTSGLGDLREVSSLIFGANLGHSFLVPHRSTSPDFSVSGLLSPPAYHRSNRAHITFYVNRRPVQGKNLIFAVTEAYKGFLPQGRYPIATILLDVRPEDLDINIHPTKSEVRFHKEEYLFAFLRNIIRETLLERAPPSEFPFTVPRESVSPAVSSDPIPLTESASHDKSDHNLPEIPRPINSISSQHPIPIQNLLPALRVVGQIRKAYIVTEGPDALYLIDQHAAHERVLYEKIREKADTKHPASQGLLEPLVITLSPLEEQFLRENWEHLASHGWELEAFGANNILIRTTPPTVTDKNPIQKFHDVLESAIAEDLKLDWSERISASMACHTAVTSGMLLPHEEMQEIVRMLETAQQPRTCPHGRPTIIRIGIHELEKGFLRK